MRRSIIALSLAPATLLAALVLSCGTTRGTPSYQPVATSARFDAYWRAGKAEITRFDLVQARYGERRTGDAVMIFVTEDFLVEEMVKLESSPRDRAFAPVLKLNVTKSFLTGIYPYSMMTSVFAPIDEVAPRQPLKVTTSVQEWCGQTWMQLNLLDGRYGVEARSYFEAEGDRRWGLEPGLLEDEIWTRIRLNPASLPVGAIRAVPSTMSARLRHVKLVAEDAIASMSSEIALPLNGADMAGRSLAAYTIRYPASARSIRIVFDRSFPHHILAWSETYRDGFGDAARELTTTAVRRESTMLDYWKHNASADTVLRRELGL